VSTYWDLVSAALQQESKVYDTSKALAATATASKLLHDAGNMCIASAVLMLVALFCASRVAGHAWMLSRVGLAQNLLTTLLGAGVVYAATVTSKYNMGGDWAADFLGGVGGFIMCGMRSAVRACVCCAAQVAALSGCSPSVPVPRSTSAGWCLWAACWPCRCTGARCSWRTW
jgi:hypothetical protein